MQYEKEKFHATISILVAAYMNNKLLHGDCSKCAVGNLCAAAGLPQEMPLDLGIEDPICAGHWGFVFMTSNGRQSFRLFKYYGNAKIAIDSTGYRVDHLAMIENAFESARVKDSDPYDTFNGLMAVVDVLCEIHGMNETEKQESKALFVKA